MTSRAQYQTFELEFRSLKDSQSYVIDLPDSLSSYCYNLDYSSNYSVFNKYPLVKGYDHLCAYYLGYQFVHSYQFVDDKVLYPPRLRDALSHFGFSFELLKDMKETEVNEHLVSIPLYTLPGEELTYDPSEVWNLKHDFLLLIDLEKASYQILDGRSDK